MYLIRVLQLTSYTISITAAEPRSERAMALAGAAAGAVLVVVSSIVGVEACNGHASFCMLLGERMISNWGKWSSSLG